MSSISLRAALAVATLALALPGAAQQAAIQEPALPTSQSPLPPPAADVPAPKRASTGSSGPTVYGYVDAQFSSTDATTPANDFSTNELRRARIGVRGDLAPTVGYTVLYDGADTSLKDGYGSLKNLRFLPGLELRFGQWKTPFGYEQFESDTKLLWVYSSYVVQALARSTSTSSLYATPDSRDLGVGAVGKWRLGAVGAELAASFANGSGPNRKDDLAQKNAWGRAGVVLPFGGSSVRAGGSYGYGRQLAGLGANGRFDGVGTRVDDTSFWFQTYGGDIEVDTPLFFLAAELIQSERDVRVNTSATASTVSPFTARGWYVGVYGKTPWKVGPVFRAERFDRNRSTTGDENERYTVGAYADIITVNARLIFNYEFDQSSKAVRNGNRAIVFGQVVF